MQLVGLSELRNLGEVRAIAQNVPAQSYSPGGTKREAWNEAAQRFSSIASQ